MTVPDRIQTLIDIALQEDIGTGDITTEAIFPGKSVEKVAILMAKEDLVVSGLEIVRRVFLTVDPQLKWERYAEDGQFVPKGTKLVTITGWIASLLRAERTALNFIQHLSGIATLTRRYVEAVKKFPVQILDTRKTTPGMRAMEKHAVRAGGGKNHRLGLYDRYLIKDNHLSGSSITEAVQKAKRHNANKVAIEVEVDSIQQIDEAVAAGADIILLDNFSPKDLKKAVQLVRNQPRRGVEGKAPTALPVEGATRAPKIEASGGINLENIVDYAKSNVDFISIGALTQSARAVDISLEMS